MSNHDIKYYLVKYHVAQLHSINIIFTVFTVVKYSLKCAA